MRLSASPDSLRVGVDATVANQLNAFFGVLGGMSLHFLNFRAYMERSVTRGTAVGLDGADSTPFNVVERDFIQGMETQLRNHLSSLIEFGAVNSVQLNFATSIPVPGRDYGGAIHAHVRNDIAENIRFIRAELNKVITKCHERRQFAALTVLQSISDDLANAHKRYLSLFPQ